MSKGEILSRAQVNAIMQIRGKRIRTLSWELRSEARQRWTARADVILPTPNEFPGRFFFDCTVNPLKYSYAFIGPRNQKLRYISEPHDGHWDPLLKAFADPRHKHYWHDEIYEATTTYIPDDITWCGGERVLLDFLRECNIEKSGELNFPLFPGRLKPLP